MDGNLLTNAHDRALALAGVPDEKTVGGVILNDKSVAIIGTRGYPSYYGGFETAVRKLAPYLAENNWAVTVYGRPGSTKPDDPERDTRVTSRTTLGLDTKSLSTLSFGFFSALDALIRKPDVVLVMNVANGFWLPLFKLRGIPTVVNVDGIEWEREKWGRVAKTVFRWGARATARWGTKMIYDAKAIADRWRVDFGLEGYVIPYGGDDPGQLEAVDGLQSRKYVLLVARFVPENSIVEFLEAVRLLPPSTTVVIVGSSGNGGDLDEAVRRLAEERPNVRWLGHVYDHQRLLSLWQHAGVYFHGHSVGGTNPALVQAMACGSPTVARDTVYNREVLDTAGVVVPASPGVMAEAITALLNDPERQMCLSKEAVARATEFYTWGSVCHAYEDALLNVRSSAQRVAMMRSESES